MAIGVAQAEDGSARTEHLLPEMGKRMRRAIGIDGDRFRRRLCQHG